MAVVMKPRLTAIPAHAATMLARAARRASPTAEAEVRAAVHAKFPSIGDHTVSHVTQIKKTGL